MCVVGLGYVGLPLVVLLGKKYHVLGYDCNHERIRELSNGKSSVLVDVKGIFNREEAEEKGFIYWSL